MSSLGWSVEFSVWNSDKFRSGHLRHIGREMKRRERVRERGGADEMSYSAVNHTVLMSLEICLAEVDAWKNCLKDSWGSGRGIALK